MTYAQIMKPSTPQPSMCRCGHTELNHDKHRNRCLNFDESGKICDCTEFTLAESPTPSGEECKYGGTAACEHGFVNDCPHCQPPTEAPAKPDGDSEFPSAFRYNVATTPPEPGNVADGTGMARTIADHCCINHNDFERLSFVGCPICIQAELATATKALEDRNEKLNFLKTKGITVGKMKSSDKPEPYLVYVIEPQSELCDLRTINENIDLDLKVKKLTQAVADQRERGNSYKRIAQEAQASALNQLGRIEKLTKALAEAEWKLLAILKEDSELLRRIRDSKDDYNHIKWGSKMEEWFQARCAEPKASGEGK